MVCVQCKQFQTKCLKLETELKFWKDKYFLEKKCRNTLTQWVLGVFGFVVKIEYDRDTQIVKVEGKESEESMAVAVFPSNGSDNKDLCLMMEDNLKPEDLDDHEENLALELDLSTANDDIDDTQQQQEEYTLSNSPINVPGQCQDQIDTSVKSVTTTEESRNNESEQNNILDILRNYGSVQQFDNQQQIPVHQQSSYIILRTANNNTNVVDSGVNEVTLDAISQSSQFQATNSPTVLYRLASASSIGEQVVGTNVSGLSTVILTTLPKPRPATPASLATQYTPPLVGSKTNNNNRKREGKASNAKEKSSSTSSESKQTALPDFGLTLREKAEIYVQEKAMEVIKKTESNQYTCTGCKMEFQFSSLENALIHAKTHFESKKYSCEICLSKFGVQKDFLTHKKSHPKPVFVKKLSKPSKKKSLLSLKNSKTK